MLHTQIKLTDPYTSSRVSARDRRNLVDDSLEKLETETNNLRESIQTMQSGQASLQSRLEEATQENEQLRKMLDEVSP
jgi:predicted nuclease with TOPRIM domain